jgi:amino acid adenylation domain-containing protein
MTNTVYPLLQQGLWIQHQQAPQSVASHAAITMRILSAVDLPALRQTFQTLVDRHAVLRSSFLTQDGQLVQQIQDRHSVAFAQIDAAGWDEQRLRAEVLAAHRRPYDLSHASLFRVDLFTRAADDHVLLIGAHQMILDHQSLWQLLSEVGLLYEGRFAELPALGRTYVDYITCQSEQLERKEEELRRYWQSQLAHVPPLLELPTDYVRLHAPQFDGATEFFTLSPELTQALKKLARDQGMTSYMLLLAAFQVLLHRYSGQEELVVGTVTPLDPESRFEQLLGYFSNLIPLRANLADNPTFSLFLRQVGQTVSDGFAHQAYPFPLLIQQLDLPHSANVSPLVQVLFNYPQLSPKLAPFFITVPSRGNPLRLPIRTIYWGGLVIAPFGLPQQEGGFDLILEMVEGAETLLGALKYNTALFKPDTIQRMVGHFQTLLASAVTNPEQRIGDLALLTDAERQQLLVEWNDTQADAPPHSGQCVHQLFEEQVERRPEAIAVVFGDQQLTYRELNARANQLAHQLIELGVGADILVGICVERSIEMVVGLLGILKAGGAYVPLDPTYPKERLQFMLQDSGVQVLLTQSKLVDTLGAGPRMYCLDQDWDLIQQEHDENPQTFVKSNHLAYCIYTSGSTGKPKGTLIIHKALTNYLTWCNKTYPVTSGCGSPVNSSIGFDATITSLFSPLLAGKQVILLPEEQEIEALAHLLHSPQKLSLIKITPAHLEILNQLWDSNNQERYQCHAFIVGGEALLKKHLTFLQTHLSPIRVINEYGPTETVVGCCIYEVPEASALPNTIPIGRPIANTQLYILDAYLQPVPIGVPGELHIGGAGLARGYLNRPQLTKEKFIPNPFSTSLGGRRLYKPGDLCRYLPDGNIEFLGRIDHQVKIRGFRIELGEIEVLLSQHAKVREVIVVAREDGLGKQLVAYLVADEAVSNNELRVYLASQLPNYMLPAAFVRLESLPLTPNGKIDRRKLPAPDYTPGKRQLVLPRTPNEALLATIWQEVLRVKPVGVHNNFFELGGHSLLATQVISRIRQTLQVELPLRQLFEFPTIAQLAPRLRGGEVTLGGETARTSTLPPIQPAQRDAAADLPLSFAQERLWFLAQLEGISATYNMPAAWRLEGTVDNEALERSLNEIHQRHEALRTTFPQKNGQAYQKIARATFSLPLVTLDELPRSRQEAEVQRLATQEAMQPFDLTLGPLWRATLVRLSKESHLLQLTMHHIISDGWSMGVFARELSALYAAYTNGQPSPLARLDIQYADFAVWQRAWLTGKVAAGHDILQKQLAYWKKQLASTPPLLSLPTDHPRPAVQSYRGRHYVCSLPLELTRTLKQLSQQMGTTLFMTLQAAFAVLLSRYSGSDDILIGTPIANRMKAEIEPLIGFFVNTLVLRNDLSANPSFSQLLKQVRQVALEAYQHQDLPFELLVDALQPERTMSHNPLFQVMFVLQNTPQEQIELAGVVSTPLEVEGSTAKFDLTLSLEERDSGLTGLPSSMMIWEYSTDIFERATIERMAGHFQTLLEGIAANPEQRIAHLPLLLRRERHQLLVEWNDTDSPTRPYLSSDVGLAHSSTRPRGGQCIHHLFEQQVERTPEATAVIFPPSIGATAEQGGAQQITYRELNSRANQLAHHLIGLGVGADVLVGISVERGIRMVVGLLAVLKAGGAYVPLDPGYPKERLQFMLSDTRPRVIITTETTFITSLPDSHPRLVCLDRDSSIICQESPANPITSVEPNNLVYVIYTSGSTGQPKGVMIEHRSLVSIYSVWKESHQLRPLSHNYLQMASFSFDIFCWDLVRALCAGGKLVLCPHEWLLEAESLYQLMLREEIDSADFVPVVLKNLFEYLEQTEQQLHFMRVMVVGSDRWLVKEYKRGLRLCAPETRFINSYGATEVTIDSSYFEQSAVDQFDDEVSLIGRPLPNVQLYILDQNLQPLPIGVAGELHIGGAGVGRGYLNRPQLTAQKFIANPFSPPKAGPEGTLGWGRARLYKTGDLCRYLPDGNLEFLGRIDHQVKIRGFRVELGEIEALLNLHPSVQEAVVIVLDSGGASGPGKQLVAYLVSSEPVSRHEMRSYLAQKLSDYMIPSAFMQLEVMPLTPNGKIDRRALPAPDGARQDTFVAPRDSTSQQLVHIWQEVLGHNEVSVRDSFFDLGGHSLLAVRLMAKIQQQFGINLPLATLFQSPTIEQLAELLASSPAKLPWSSLVPIQSQGNQPPFFCVPGVGGNVLNLYDLARQMDQPFYALQAVGLDGETPPYTTVEAMAAHYINLILPLQGPYLLGGHSFGGLVIFEMAQQLKEAGHDVAQLMIFDLSAPTPRASSEEATWDDAKWLLSLAELISELTGQYVDLSYEVLLPLDPQEQLIRFKQVLEQSDIMPARFDLKQLRGLLQVLKTNSLMDYVPRDVISTPITLFRALDSLSSSEETDEQEELQSTLGWNELTDGPVTVILVPGNHFTMMAQPHVQVLAKEVEACLERALCTPKRSAYYDI